MFLPYVVALTFQRAFSASLSPLKHITEQHIDETFDLLRPTPRLCVNSSSYELEQYKSAVNKAIRDITAGKILELMKSASGLSMDAISHKICLAQPWTAG